MVRLQQCALALGLLITTGIGHAVEDADYYRILTYPLPENVIMEASGLAVLPDGRLAVAIRRGEVWMLDHPEATPATTENVGFKKFASGMHEVLGLAWHEGALYATQRAEITRLRDLDGDGVADEYATVSTGWGVSGNYHEYAYGPAIDKAGNFYTSLNASLGKGWEGAGDEAKLPLWRGWCMRTVPGSPPEPWAAGFRSPCGIGTDLDGEVFVTDQQGNWFGTNPLLHVRKGAFFGHGDALRDMSQPNSPIKSPGKLPEGITTAEAIQKVPGYCPPAVWFPYVKMGQSPTGFRCDGTGGKFGPFARQMFVGEFVLSGVNRVFLERVGGELQGACFPFIKGLQCASLSVNFLADGSMVIGQSNRGWNSAGNRPFGLQRIVWTGKTPLEVAKMEAKPDGFNFTFTLPIDPASVSNEAFNGISYTYTYQSKYGSPEMDPQDLKITSAELSDDQTQVHVKVANLRPGYVHEFKLPELKSQDGQHLWHRDAYYTLNRIPTE